MKNRLHHIAFTIMAFWLLAGCAPGKGHVEPLSVTPASCMLVPDSGNNVEIALRINVPAHYMSARSRLVIRPELVVGETVRDAYRPIVLDAPIYRKKLNRLRVLEGYEDPYASYAECLEGKARGYEADYREIVRLPEGVDSARIVGVVTADGCGTCSGIDTVMMAFVRRSLPVDTEVRDTFRLFWMEPEFRILPKVVNGEGTAHLQFEINRHDINLAMGRNRDELEDMTGRLAPILRDSLATLTRLDIYGMASADGPLQFNTALSRQRAESARSWLVERLGVSPDVQRAITVGSRPEGWLPVLEAMKADGDPDSLAVKAILDRYPDGDDDVQERHIRRLPAWNRIKARYLQKDRKVEYVYSYTVKNFTTDGELLEMYGKRPDAFNEEELLRVATLMSGDEERKQVYLTILKKYPASRVAANNLGVIYLREGNAEEARRVVREAQERGKEGMR